MALIADSAVLLKSPLAALYDAPFENRDSQRELWSQNLRARDLISGSVAWQQSLLLGRLRSRFHEISELNDNWDSYGSASPTPDSLATAKALIDWAASELPTQIFETDIVPSTEGGVAITFHSASGARYAHIEILNDCDSRLMLAEDDDLIELEKLSQPVDHLRDAVKKASRFVSESLL